MKRSLFIFLFVLAVQYVFCQANPDNFAKMVDFLPPPPNAAAITKAGLIGLNKNTGAPSISIPLYQVKGRNLGMEVSLTYSSNGIKVDEIASRVGMGWAINAGGVVTRTVRGLQDELNTRLLPTGNFGDDWPTYNFFNNIGTATPSGSYDGEPDLFNFSVDGISGSFVFDENMQVVLVPHNNVKIEYDFNSTIWNFKLTGPDGTKYYFGGNTATETTKRMQTCGKIFGAYIPTAWYLKKIEHLNGEIITLNYTALEYSYDTGISETRTYTNGNPGYDPYSSTNFCDMPAPGGPGWEITNCKNYVNTRGVLLDEIVTDNYAKVKFNYTTRPDANDKLISSIVETDLTNNTNIRSFGFNYTNNATATYNNYQGEGFTVPYLTSLTENSADNLQTKTHYFTYDDPGARPCRLSYAQDHWGFFNGKNNTMLVPKIDELSYMFPLVTGNREADFNFTTKGMLKKIVYPTGGIQTIEYEPHISHGSSSGMPLHTVTCQVTGEGPQMTVYKVIPLTITNQQFQWLKIHLVSYCSPGFTCDGIHDYSRVDIKNGNGNIIYTQGLFPDQSTDFTVPISLAGDYTLTLNAVGRASSGVTVEYHPVITTLSNADIILAGGVRVKSILTGNPNEMPILKKYYYGEMQSLDVSTLGAQREPSYLTIYKISHPSFHEATSNSPSAFCSWSLLFNALHSNSLSNLFDYNNQIASYGSVVEGIGENFEGGATQTKFNVFPDEGPITAWGTKMLNAPAVNTALALNGKPTEETIFRKNSSGQLIPVSKKAYTYNVTSMRQIPGYVVNKFRNPNFIPNQNTTFAAHEENMYLIRSFDVMKYYVYAPWTVTETVTENLYDENGSNPLTTSTTNHYTNNVHLQLTSSETVNSKNETITSINKYPQDYAGNAVYDAMLTNHIITPVIDSRVTNSANSTDIEEAKNNYASWGNGNYNTASIQKSVKGNALENLGTITMRDAYGNIVEFTGKDGITNAIIWGYKNTYPVAKIAYAGYNQAIAQLSVTMTALQSMDGATLLTELNRIRTGIPAAQITTYTYKPLVGVTSITDPNNKANTYEYDAFSRLALIKDQGDNVVKKIDYQYAGGNAQSTFNVYYNDQQQGSFTCQHCAYGYTASSSVLYTVAAGRFYSLISIQDANAKAQAFLQLNGPVYAEVSATNNSMCLNSSCPPSLGGNCTTSNCTGVDKKCINNVCSTGYKIYLSSVYDRSTHTWTCTYYYRFSDTSTNPAGAPTNFFTETSSSSCMGSTD